MTDSRLTRQAVTRAAGPDGWRLVFDTIRANVHVPSIAAGAALATAVVEAVGPEAGARLWIDLRRNEVLLTLRTLSAPFVTSDDLAAAARISAAVAAAGFATSPTAPQRPAQGLEIAIDALDIAAIRPFWKAVLGYGDDVDDNGPEDAIIDPLRQSPSVWFQQMDAPRPQRNRIHFDIAVGEDEAGPRLAASIAAGGILLSDAKAPAFWVLADPEGNEICICTWQARD